MRLSLSLITNRHRSQAAHAATVYGITFMLLPRRRFRASVQHEMKKEVA